MQHLNAIVQISVLICLSLGELAEQIARRFAQTIFQRAPIAAEGVAIPVLVPLLRVLKLLLEQRVERFARAANGTRKNVCSIKPHLHHCLPNYLFMSYWLCSCVCFWSGQDRLWIQVNFHSYYCLLCTLIWDSLLHNQQSVQLCACLFIFPK